jgi:hypothetical protein
MHGVRWGRSRAALDFHIYIHLAAAPGSGIARLGAGGPPVARCSPYRAHPSIGGGARFAAIDVLIYDQRAEMQMTRARRRVVPAREIEKERESMRVLCMNL